MQHNEYNEQLYQIFISKNANYTAEWGSVNQKKWAEYAYIAVQRCINWLQTYPNNLKSLQKIYEFCANERFKIGMLLGHSYGYGMSRLVPDDYDEEPRISPFLAKRLRLKGQFEELYAKFTAAAQGKNVVYLVIENNIFIYSTIRPDNHDEIVVTFTWNEKEEKISVQYPNSKVARKLLQRANEIWLQTYQQKDVLTTEQKFKQLAKILWHLAISCTSVYGNAAISEFIFHALSTQLGLPILPLTAEKSWDITAIFTMNDDEFAHWFYDFMITHRATNMIYTNFLPLLDDDSEEIERAAERINNSYLLNNIDQTAQLIDPYGLSLYHYCILNLVLRHDLSKQEKIDNIQITSKFLDNGQNLLLDAISCKSYDPVLFFIETGMKNKHFFYHGKDELINIKLILMEEIKKFISIIEENPNKFCMENFNKLKEYIAACYPNTPQKHDQPIKEQLGTLCEFVNNQEEFSYVCLKSLAIHSYHIKYFKKISLLDLLTIREEFGNQALLTILLKYNSSFICSIPDYLKELTYIEDLHSLLDCMLLLDIKYQQKIFIDILDYLNNLDLSTEEIKSIIFPWKEKHPEFYLFPIIYHANSLSEKNMDALKILINQNEINLAYDTGKVPLYYLIVNDKISLIKFLLECGANINLVINSSSDKLVMQKFCDLLYNPFFDKEIILQLCTPTVCLNLNPEALIQPYVKEEYYFETQDKNFCLLLNRMVKILKEEDSSAITSSHFFSTVSPVNRLKKAVLEGLTSLITSSCPDNKIFTFLSNVDFLINDDIQYLKKLIETKNLQDSFQETIQLIDSMIIKQYTPPGNK